MVLGKSNALTNGDSSNADPSIARRDPRSFTARLRVVLVLFSITTGLLPLVDVDAAVGTDLESYSPDCGVQIDRGPSNRLIARWPASEKTRGELVLNLTGEGRLIESIRVGSADGAPSSLLDNLDPSVQITVASRGELPDKDPQQKWRVFFDNPFRRPHETFASRLELRAVKVRSSGKRATISVDGIEAGPFRGTVELTFYQGTPLVRIDFVVRTERDSLAIFYDAGLVTDRPNWPRFVWKDTEGQMHSVPAADARDFQPLAVQHRTIIAESERGSVACFSPPHQFQFPRDYSDNLKFVWYGPGKPSLDEFGFGIRQNKEGGGNFVPWFNAPPGVEHRLGMFLLISPGPGREALDETLRFTNGDRFRALPGYRTMTSHYHMAISVQAMEEAKRGVERTTPPEYVKIFKDMGVEMVHLGEFHGDGHQKDPGPLRLPEMEAMFHECRRWSDETLLLIPGEEVNTFLGLELKGKHPGHWMSLFPRPVYWTMTRDEGMPFVEQHPQYGKVYRVGGRADMIRLIKEEDALVWAAHPRIKASNWTPDIFREEDFFIADYWLGGAWKAMPGDLSRERLGERVLDLQDDMANWGHKKYVLGEVDVFKIDHTHELYGHMNVNYLKMDRLPKFDDGWQPVLDTLRNGQFFVTTGEVLIPLFEAGGKPSGETLAVAEDPVEVRCDVEWTFPLSFAEIISGDGQRVHRERIDLSETSAFGKQTLNAKVGLRGRHWVRLEVWDVAANGAFTQPVWLENER